MDPSESFVSANGLRHHVLTWDGGGSTTVLCLHGFLDLAWGFQPLGPLLAAAGLHVVAPSLRGHGRTERIGAGGYYHFFDYVFDTAELADALSRERLVIVGHSMGGMIASLFAGTFPARASRVALLEGLYAVEQPLDELPRRTAAWISSVRRLRGKAPRLYPTLEDAAARLTDVDPRCPPELARLLAEKGTDELPGGRAFQHDPLHLTRGPYAFRLDQVREYWSAVTAPVLAVHGGESEFPPPDDLEERHACFPELRTATLPGAGHMMIRHRPTELAALLLPFLAGA